MLATASAAAARARAGHISTGQQSAATKLGAACSPPRSLSPPRGRLARRARAVAAGVPGRPRRLRGGADRGGRRRRGR